MTLRGNVSNKWKSFSKKALFKIGSLTGNRKALFRWTLGLNVFGLAIAFAYNSDQIDKIVTYQTQLLSDMQIPVPFRSYLYNFYSRRYSVNIQEVQLPFNQYSTLSQFFTRKIKRKAADQIPQTIGSPCDGKILSFSEIVGNECSIIKDRKYSMSQLTLGVDQNQINTSIVDILKTNKGNKLYQIIIYLAPGDYHRFHSPTHLTILKRKKIQGDVSSVNEEALLSKQNIYQTNARITLFTKWKQGMMALVLVGALNVSRILVSKESQFQYGQQLGYFNLGSTIVMIIQAKGVKQWTIKQGQPIKYGDSLFYYE